MAKGCFSTVCCDEDAVRCIKEVCGDNVKVDSVIAAMAIIENDTVPVVGNTITLNGVSVLLEDCNYMESLEKWIREKQFECPADGRNYIFLHAGLMAKGTRAKPTLTFSENGSPYVNNKLKSYETTAEIFLEENYLPNAGTFCDMMQNGSSLSVIYFFKQGGFVINSDAGINLTINDAGFEVTGQQNDFISGSVTLGEKGKCQPQFYTVNNPDSFIKKLKGKTEFTFGVPTITGLTEVACGSNGKCKAYNATAATAFTITPDVNEHITC